MGTLTITVKLVRSVAFFGCILLGTLTVLHHRCLGFQQIMMLRKGKKATILLSSTSSEEPCQRNGKIRHISNNRKFLIHWRGEKDFGYSKPFRHVEFASALAAECDEIVDIDFLNALNYTGKDLPGKRIEEFNEAMQFLSFANSSSGIKDTIIRTAQRCSLVHAVYEVVASSKHLDDLAEKAIDDGGCSDLYSGGKNEKATWCFRARSYNNAEIIQDHNDDDVSFNDGNKRKRYGSRTRSMGKEKVGLRALKKLFIKFGGTVSLKNPDTKIYIFDGIGLENENTLLVRRIATGPKTSIISPNQRICVTNTPLEPIAAFVLCNIARINNSTTVLDPYAGSCSILLAAAIIAPSAESVGIEIAHDGFVNREHIYSDFTSRKLKIPNKLIHGDSTDPVVRKGAISAIDNNPFDVIIADPPYGIRESVSSIGNSPLEELFMAVASDRSDDKDLTSCNKRLLKLGGRLVAFVPVTDEQTLTEMLPSDEMTKEAGLELELWKEQILNQKLSRWLVSYISIV